MDAPSVFEFDGFKSKILRGVFLLLYHRFYGTAHVRGTFKVPRTLNRAENQ